MKAVEFFNFDRGTSSQRELRQRVRRGHSELLRALQSLQILPSRAAENYWLPNRQIRPEFKNGLALMTVANGNRALKLTNTKCLGAEVEEKSNRYGARKANVKAEVYGLYRWKKSFDEGNLRYMRFAAALLHKALNRAYGCE